MFKPLGYYTIDTVDTYVGQGSDKTLITLHGCAYNVVLEHWTKAWIKYCSNLDQEYVYMVSATLDKDKDTVVIDWLTTNPHYDELDEGSVTQKHSGIQGFGHSATTRLSVDNITPEMPLWANALYDYLGLLYKDSSAKEFVSLCYCPSLYTEPK